MSLQRLKAVATAFVISLLGLAGTAAAQTAAPAGDAAPIIGAPEPWQLWHQPAASPVMEALDDFHVLLLWIMVAICIFVLALMGYVAVRFNHRRNPTPSKTSHNTLVEVIWTVVPVILLVIIAIPSFQLLYASDRAVDAEMTLKVTGRQWYWDYEYPDHGNLAFSSYMVPPEELGPDQLRLLDVDNRVVLPVDTNIRILSTAGDVLHSWAVPSFGVKIDSVPGRLNETWVRIVQEGVYYGQCSEICGTGHAYMPVAVEAVSKERFAEWIATQQAKAGIAPAKTQVAQAPAAQ